MMIDRQSVKGFCLGIASATGISLALYAGIAIANQPRMANALSALNTAKSELQAATANKDGHRIKAIGLVDAAINEVQAGISAAD